ncbi:hypothetical protein POTOM_001368 [Populus tomentosa]|uniref:Retrotransposon Copia-like N-terminal domain-containing protein n=1 Tax=Populus tomentosa TaxID=118781 RepID=A0A8X8DHU1_POPTO|nr:hypothetical protein POTOM_001368 [Populus tomentosa]
MTTPTSPSSVFVISSSLSISLVALTNDFSTHLNADNYLLWRDQITHLLICNDLYSHIDGTDPPPLKTISIDGTLHARLLVHEQELERIRGRASPPLAPLSHHALVAQQHYQSFRNSNHGNFRRPSRPKHDHVIVVAVKYANKRVILRLIALINSPDYVSPLWFGDTGAMNHMASHTDLVQQPLPFNGTSGVYVGNGDSLCISHIGNS